MHQAAYSYVESVVPQLPVAGARVLEIGSFNVNGSVRPLFSAGAAYVGIDRQPGYGVDVAADARAYDGGETFDIAITTEALEHDAEPEHIITCAWRALRPGGWIVITCAGEGRTPHGCDGGPLPPWEAYQNVTRAHMERLLDDWQAVAITENRPCGDIYAVAQKPYGYAEA